MSFMGGVPAALVIRPNVSEKKLGAEELVRSYKLLAGSSLPFGRSSQLTFRCGLEAVVDSPVKVRPGSDQAAP
jgi:hypothetical protein